MSHMCDDKYDSEAPWGFENEWFGTTSVCSPVGRISVGIVMSVEAEWLG